MVLDAVAVHPLTPSRWPDLEKLFGPRGACGGCWCMYWKLKRSEFEACKGESNRRLQEAHVRSGEEPGLLAYVAGQPAGWCALEPRQNYPVLANSRILRPVDDRPAWALPCFFIEKRFRRQGLSVALLNAAVQHVGRRGGSLLEGYPIDPGEKGSVPAVFAYTGLMTAFVQAGFREVARRSATRPIMRREIPG